MVGKPDRSPTSLQGSLATGAPTAASKPLLRITSAAATSVSCSYPHSEQKCILTSNSFGSSDLGMLKSQRSLEIEDRQ